MWQKTGSTCGQASNYCEVRIEHVPTIEAVNFSQGNDVLRNTKAKSRGASI
jgi:hypothetical protein